MPWQAGVVRLAAVRHGLVDWQARLGGRAGACHPEQAAGAAPESQSERVTCCALRRPQAALAHIAAARWEVDSFRPTCVLPFIPFMELWVLTRSLLR